MGRGAFSNYMGRIHTLFGKNINGLLNFFMDSPVGLDTNSNLMGFSCGYMLLPSTWVYSVCYTSFEKNVPETFVHECFPEICTCN